ncbi:MAG: glycogen synthase GlgA [Proteobacteria bacterium]|nr:glycogen synthase GlgA [Cystobacterineae bacterium]MCL2314169.1 glycogen synthase GlgA [Pseudomonadota bacterium]
MRILFLSSEVAPYSKTGGLGDVSGALPAVLAKRGHEVVVVTPRYATVPTEGLSLRGTLWLHFPFGAQWAEVWEVRAGNLRTLFIRQPAYFDRGGFYAEGGVEYTDNHRRFAFFSMAALSAAQMLGLCPQVIHLNEWQTCLAALALKRGYESTPLGQAKTLLSIHNLAYQGIFPSWAVEELGLPWELFSPDGFEFWGQLSFLKTGLVFADALSTVSRRYAQEIQTPEYGFGLEGILQKRAGVLRGILNGIDSKLWNPATDVFLPARYSREDMSGKEVCSEALLERFGLSSAPKRPPIFGMVSRMVEQKGIELILGAIPGLVEAGARVIIIGTGEGRFEGALREMAQRFPQQVGVFIGFDETLSHCVEAGSDFFMMPSKFEPCGLNQLYSLRYGAIPVVRAVGGLEDSIIDAGVEGGEQTSTGIKFGEFSLEAFEGALRRALGLFKKPKLLLGMRKRAMGKDFSWEHAAKEYEALYESLLGAGEDATSAGR